MFEKNQLHQLLSHIRSNSLFRFTLAKVVQTNFCKALGDCFDQCVDMVVFHRGGEHVDVRSGEKWLSQRVDQHSGGEIKKTY